jgi:cytochrome bd-type quinol oxidase subunit 2
MKNTLLYASIIILLILLVPKSSYYESTSSSSTTSSSTTSSSTTSSSSDDKKMSDGMFYGIAIGLPIFLAVAVFMYRKMNDKPIPKMYPNNIK